jgi:hypothetical protein
VKSRPDSLKLSGVGVTERVGGGGVVASKRGSGDIVRVDVIVLEYCLLALSEVIIEGTYHPSRFRSGIESCPLL